MTQPVPYVREFSFTGFQSGHPRTPLPGDKVDGELDLVATVLDEVLVRIAILQRDDTELANHSVGYDQLKTEVVLGFGPPLVWESGKVYAVRDTVFSGSAFYLAIVAHTSGEFFSVDLAAHKWEILADFMPGTETSVDAAAAALASQQAAAASQAIAEAAAISAAASQTAALGFSGSSAASAAAAAASAAAAAISAAEAAASAAAIAGGAPVSRTITAGAGLTGGGTLAADRTFNVGAGTGILANTDDVAIDKATAANVQAATSNKVLSADIIFTAADPVTLTDAATIAVDMATFLNAKVTLGGNRTLGAPTNPKNGQSGCIEIIQDGTGTRTLTYHADWLFAGGTDPVLSTVAGTKDLLFFQVLSTGKTFANLVKAIA